MVAMAREASNISNVIVIAISNEITFNFGKWNVNFFFFFFFITEGDADFDLDLPTVWTIEKQETIVLADHG